MDVTFSRNALSPCFFYGHRKLRVWLFRLRNLKSTAFSGESEGKEVRIVRVTHGV